MKRIERSWILTIAAVAWVAGVPVMADGDEKDRAERVRPSYVREQVRRPAADAPPQVEAVPSDLHMDVEADSQASSPGERLVLEDDELGASRTRPGHGSRSDVSELEREARRQGAHAAEEVARTLGWRQYYRVGFHRGMRVALRDDRLGRWDFHEGLRFGSRDPEARLLGAGIGARTATELSREAAELQVAEQFHDLAREPRFDPHPGVPGWAPHGKWAAEPAMSDVFHDWPAARVPGIGRRAGRAFESWDWDTGRLHRAERHGDFYRADWRDPSRAFNEWKVDHRRRSGAYRHLRRDADRALFRTAFKEEFSRRLADHYDRHLRRGYDEGFQDGWRYGAFVTYEWHYRLGYTQGFDEAVATAAVAGFHASYPLAYRTHYDTAFDDWSRNPKPEIVSVRLADGNDDAVFQPGEELLVDFEIANYGGAAGTYTVAVNGTELERPEEITVRLEPRDIARTVEPLSLRILAGTPPRTRTNVELSVADRIETVGMLVSYPLEFTGEVDLVSDNLGGKARVSVQVCNTSSKSIRGTVSLDDTGGRSTRLAEDLGVLPAGARDWTTFDVAGLRPLDMIAGRVTMRFSMESDGVVQDGLEYLFPDVASDLGNRDLLDLMVLLAHDPTASRADVLEARGLMLRRLQTDWQASVRSRGNPYKQDFKSRGTRTALGDLVRTYEEERRSFRSPEVFRGLDREIEEMAEEQPGTHPFLRKYMKRLARRLG